MKTKLKYISNAWKHFKTISKHKQIVMINCIKAGQIKRGLLHDNSKFSPTEFFSSVKYYQGNRSPIDAEKEDKGYIEGQKPNTTVVMLIPARTDTKYFHNYIYHDAKEIRFIKGRLKFGNSKNSAPFPSMIVIYQGPEE